MSQVRRFHDERVTFPMVFDQAVRLLNVDSEDDRGWARERRKLWRLWRKSVERRAMAMMRKVQREERGR